MLPKLTDLWDARARADADRDPLQDSVNIPHDELEGRRHELPRPSIPLRVNDPDFNLKLPEDSAWRRDTNLKRGSSDRCRLWRHNELLDQVSVPAGKALDLGCGSGRDAVALACQGWQVTAVDHLPRSFDLARDLEHRYSDGPPVDWLERDLRQGPPPGTFDLVTALFFWKPEAIVQASHQINPGGFLLIEMFTPTDKEKHGKPKHPTDAAEISRLFAHLREIALSEEWHFGRHTVRYIGQRTA